MNEERRRVLDMLSEGKINADEAERLLNALNAGARAEADSAIGNPFGNVHRIRRHLHRMHEEHRSERRYLRVIVDRKTPEGRTERVRLKVPVKLLKAGISLSGLMPKDVREQVQAALKEKGVDVDPFALRGADADDIVAALADLEIDIGDKGEKVRIFVAEDDEEDDDGDGEGVTARETEGPGGERTVERTIRRRFRRDSGLSFVCIGTAPFRAAGYTAAYVFRLALVPLAWLTLAALRLVMVVAWLIGAPFRLVGRWFRRGLIARASWRRGSRALTDRTIAA
ncbi:MAG: DUF2089 domain-containing protein [Alphaproteobacteria bacterium]|nr:DUF2089 domain-containing protein [Alphaproteobacteria bacterium]